MRCADTIRFPHRWRTRNPLHHTVFEKENRNADEAPGNVMDVRSLPQSGEWMSTPPLPPCDPTDRALENVRALAQRSRALADEEACAAAGVQSVGIVGAGLMGISIAAAHLKYRLPVVLADARPEALAAVPERLTAELAQDMPAAEARRLVEWLARTGDEAAVGRCDLVIEAIAENTAAKQELFRRLEGRLAARTLWTSNTSTIPIGRLSAGLAAAGRFGGLHFCHPVRSRPLVEIIRGPQTRPATIAALVDHVRAIDRLPLVVEDGPGFVVNRILQTYLGEAMDLLLEGAAIEAIEQAMRDFGMAVGPLEAIDQIGLDVALGCGWVLAAALGERVVASPIMTGLIRSGRLGYKSGEGFFRYAAGPAAEKSVSPLLPKLIAQWARPPRRHDAQSIAARLLSAMILEAARILHEGKVRDPRDINLAMVFGLGFPESRGGLLYWADGLGADALLSMLASAAADVPRLAPPDWLVAAIASGRRFY